MKQMRRHSWLVTLPLVAIVAAYLWLVFLPGQRVISALETELADKRAFIASGVHVSRCRVEFETKLADLRTYCEQWQAKPCDSAGLAALYGEIAELLKASGVVTTHFSPGPTQKLDILKKTALKIECEGTFEQVASVLTSLEKMPGRLWVENVSLETLADSGVSIRKNDDKIGQIMRCQVNLVIFAGNSEKTD
jgi:Tfp pilus assembly protein PilO